MLPELQRRFKAYVTDHVDEFASAVCDTSKASRHALLGVYREAYVLRLHECLGNDYPGLRAMLGEERFFALARAYIAAHPSRHPNARWFGRALPGFVASWAEPQETAACADMARFEWALGEAQDEVDAVPFDFNQLAALPAEAWARLTLRFHPSVRRLRLGTQAPQSWLRREDDTETGLKVPAEEAPVEWLIWRQGIDAQFRSMEADEALAFDAAARGESFPSLCEVLGGLVGEDQAPARAAGLLRAWVDAGLVVGQSS